MAAGLRRVRPASAFESWGRDIPQRAASAAMLKPSAEAFARTALKSADAAEPPPFAAADAAPRPSIPPGRIEVSVGTDCKRGVCGVCGPLLRTVGANFERFRCRTRVCSDCASVGTDCEIISEVGVCEIGGEGRQRMKSLVGG